MFLREQMRTVLAREGRQTPYKNTQRRHSRNVKSSSKKNNIELMKEGKHPPSKLNGSPNKKRGDSISKGKTKKGAKYKCANIERTDVVL